MAEYDSVIPPGGQGKLKAKVHTRPGQTGRMVKTVGVQTDAPGAENLNLSVALEIYNPVDVKPRPQVYLNSMVGEPASARVLISRSDRKPLEVTVTSPAQAGLTVTTAPVTKAEEGPEGIKAQPGDIWLQVEVANPNVVGNTTTNLVVATNHPDMKEITLPVTARTRALIEARPGEVRLFVGGGDAAAQSMLFRVTHNGGKEFAISGIETSAPQLITVTAESTGRQQTHQLRVAFTAGVDLAQVQLPFAGAITLQTDVATTPTVTVPVLLVQRNARPVPVKSSAPPPPLNLVRPTGTPGVG